METDSQNSLLTLSLQWTYHIFVFPGSGLRAIGVNCKIHRNSILKVGCWDCSPLEFLVLLSSFNWLVVAEKQSSSHSFSFLLFPVQIHSSSSSPKSLLTGEMFFSSLPLIVSSPSRTKNAVLICLFLAAAGFFFLAVGFLFWWLLLAAAQALDCRLSGSKC